MTTKGNRNTRAVVAALAVLAFLTEPKCTQSIKTSRTTAFTKRRSERIRRAAQWSNAYRTLFEYAPDGILIADPNSYYIDANPSILPVARLYAKN